MLRFGVVEAAVEHDLCHGIFDTTPALTLVIQRLEKVAVNISVFSSNDWLNCLQLALFYLSSKTMCSIDYVKYNSYN